MTPYPTLEQVDTANKTQLARWYRHLPGARTEEQAKIIDRVVERFKDLGGWTPALSKAIGW